MLRTALLLALNLAVAVQALTANQLLLAFPAASSSPTSLSGSTASLPEFTFTVVTNTSHALLVLNATRTAPSSIGWLGIGHGTSMANADFLIAWPTLSDSSVSWTLSHRLPGSRAHDEPVLPSGAPSSAFFSLVPALTSTVPGNAYTTVAWIRALDPGAAYPSVQGGSQGTMGRATERFIYASSSRNPGSADEGATVGEHDQPHGATSLDLSNAITLPSTPSAGDSSPAANDLNGGSVVSSTSPRGRTSRDKALIAHATLGSLALVVFLPSALLLARLGRDKLRWFPGHAALNSAGVVLVIACFGIGVNEGGGQFDDLHKRLGLSLLLLLLVQPLLGLLAHRTPPSPLTSSRPSLRAPRLPPSRAAHLTLGLLILALGYLQLANGMYSEWPQGSDAKSAVPAAVKGVFWALVAVEIAVYGGTWGGQLVRSWRGQGRRSGAGTSVDSGSEEMEDSGSAVGMVERTERGRAAMA